MFDWEILYAPDSYIAHEVTAQATSGPRAIPVPKGQIVLMSRDLSDRRAKMTTYDKHRPRH